MNPNLEACRNCKFVNKCELDKRVNNVIEAFDYDGTMTVDQGRRSLSDAVGWGVRNGCPPSEKAAAKKAGLQVIAPAFANSERTFTSPSFSDQLAQPEKSSYERALRKRRPMSMK